MAKKFEEVRVWHEAARLYEAVLDLLEVQNNPFTPAFRHQLDQAALDVPRQIAESVEVYPRSEQVTCLSRARASVRQVRHMLAAVTQRPKVKAVAPQIDRVFELAESCGRQLTAFVRAIEENRKEPGSANEPAGDRGGSGGGTGTARPRSPGGEAPAQGPAAGRGVAGSAGGVRRR